MGTFVSVTGVTLRATMITRSDLKCLVGVSLAKQEGGIFTLKKQLPLQDVSGLPFLFFFSYFSFTLQLKHKKFGMNEFPLG